VKLEAGSWEKDIRSWQAFSNQVFKINKKETHSFPFFVLLKIRLFLDKRL
jgi:hypothetical protein